MNPPGSQVYERTPRLGSEVRFANGGLAGRVGATNDRDFLVVKGRKRIRQFNFPYSSIQSIDRGIVTLRSIQPKSSRRKAIPPVPDEKEGVSKKTFIQDLGERLAVDDPERAERIARVVLYLLSKRLSADQKRKLRGAMPLGIRSLWATVQQEGNGEYFDMSNFLLPVRRQGRLGSMEEAFIATREVFSSLKKIMPTDQSIEISRSLPMELREIWESATERGITMKII